MNLVNKKKIISACCSTVVAFSLCISPANAFIVKDIKVNGLQRVSVGTVLNYLPVQIGEDLEPGSTADIIRALYDTGFFQSVSLERNGNTLVVNVVERATIGSINLMGNKELPTDKLNELLKQIGLVKGQVFRRSSLDSLEKELKQAYNARGKYNARIETKVTPLTENRVGITINISEGRVSRIKEIKFIGNHDFASNELLPQMALSTSDLFTYFTKKDQYSKAEMDASLEALRSFYLDRGYLKFSIVSSQVMLSPDKKDVYISIHVHEGPQYRFSGYSIVGRTILPKEKLDPLIQVKKGDVFSRKKVTESVSDISLALGDIGYGFPVINVEPKINETDHTVLIVFVVEAGRHVYVRHINFHGNTKTGDYVLRNVIRQHEGALLSLHNIKESERQLRVLGYLKDIDIKTNPVAGTNNQVDLDVNLEEAPAAEASASVGYGSNGPQVNAALNHHNFMGSGRSVGFTFNASYWGQDYSLNYYNPFYTKTGVGRGFNVYYQTMDPKRLDVASYSSDRFGGDVTYSVLVGEKSSLQLGYGYQDLNIKSVGRVQQVQNFVNLYGKDFQEIRLIGGWSRNSYDQFPYPTRGFNQQATSLIALPANHQSLSYYKASYRVSFYQPLFKGFIFNTMGNVGYGNQFDDKGLPVYENYYAGGIAQPGQVRGYESFSLGPKDVYGNSIGANLIVNGTAGIVLPYPLSRDNIRTTLFVDAGNIYACNTPALLQGTPSGPLRYSSGLAFEWRSPMGPLSFSVAKPINLQPNDRESIFQFTVSSGF